MMSAISQRRHCFNPRFEHRPFLFATLATIILLVTCPLCGARSALFRIVDNVGYYECNPCEFIFADPTLLDRADSGKPLRAYDAEYWAVELPSARERAFGSSLARVAEAILYARRPIRRFIDISSGPGYLLDALHLYLPDGSSRFYGVEQFPPPTNLRSTHPNYSVSGMGSVSGTFQAGVCIETLEHLTPKMAREFAASLARISDAQALYIFNTGLVPYVKHQDPTYLDPYGRGHITCWSVAAARKIFEPAGFTVAALPGKTWAFVIEFEGKGMDNMLDRIWTPPAENKQLLHDHVMGSALYILGLETARAYCQLL